MRRNVGNVVPLHRLQKKPLVSNPAMHHGTCITHVPGCMSGSLTRVGGENVLGIPGACANRNFTYLVRGPWLTPMECIMPIMIQQRRNYSNLELISGTVTSYCTSPDFHQSTQAIQFSNQYTGAGISIPFPSVSGVNLKDLWFICDH